MVALIKPNSAIPPTPLATALAAPHATATAANDSAASIHTRTASFDATDGVVARAVIRNRPIDEVERRGPVARVGTSTVEGSPCRRNVSGRNLPRSRNRAERSQFRALIVRPRPGFQPRDWRERPKSFEIVHDMGVLPFRGLRDAWLFQQNKRALESGELGLWAICLPQLTEELADTASA